MKSRSKFINLFFVIVFFHNINCASASLASDAETIFNWAEDSFIYFPFKETTLTFDPWLYRFYPTTGIYLGVNQNDLGVYVLGGEFGDEPLYVDSVENILKLVGSDIIPNILGLYTGTSRNTISNCNNSLGNRENISSGQIEIKSQDGENFSGSGSFSATIEGVVVEEVFEITGTVRQDRVITGNLDSNAFVNGEPGGSGSSSFNGTLNDSGSMILQTPEQDLGIDNCKTSGTTIDVMKQNDSAKVKQ